MRINSITVRVSKKFNIGNYESVDVEVSLNADIDEDEDVSVVTQSLIDQCKCEIKEAAPNSKKKLGIAA